MIGYAHNCSYRLSSGLAKEARGGSVGAGPLHLSRGEPICHFGASAIDRTGTPERFRATRRRQSRAYSAPLCIGVQDEARRNRHRVLTHTTTPVAARRSLAPRGCRFIGRKRDTPSESGHEGACQRGFRGNGTNLEDGHAIESTARNAGTPCLSMMRATHCK